MDYLKIRGHKEILDTAYGLFYDLIFFVNAYNFINFSKNIFEFAS